MDARSLKTLLRTLQEFGVNSYRDADVSVQFGGTYGPPVPESDVEGAEGLKLPPDVPDVARALADIRKAYEPKGRRPQ